MDLTCKLQNTFLIYLKQIRNNEQKSIETFCSLLNLIENILNRNVISVFDGYSTSQIYDEFLKNFYSNIFYEILFNFNKPNLFDDNKPLLVKFKHDLATNLFKTNYEDTFRILTKLCLTLASSSQRDFCMELLGLYVTKHLFNNLFQEKCCFVSNKLNASLVEDPLAGDITSLPDKLANLCVNRLNNVFYPLQFYTILAVDFNSALNHVYNSIKSNKDASIEFLCVIYGRLCFLGYSDMISKVVVKNLIKNCEKDAIWMRISQKLFTSIPYKYLEHCLSSLVKTVNHHQDLSILLGDSVLTYENIKVILTNRFLYWKIFPKDVCVQNIIGYLNDSPSRRGIYHETFKELLTIWSNQASITNTSYEQHLYITKCILVCTAFLTDNDKEAIGSELMKSILKGVEKHLSSPIAQMRTLGMLLGEALMNQLNEGLEKEKKLKFEYDSNAETQSLLTLLTRPAPRQVSEDIDDKLNELSILNEEEKVIVEDKTLNVKITQNEVDSDDDLEPYDLSNDIQVTKEKQPAYLRDCLDGLIYSEDSEKVELCLKSIESLCKNYHYELKEVCVELAKILLHKANNYSIEDFEELRMKGLVEVTVHYPIEVSKYLTEQFYEANYTITQRLDVLHVLAISAQKLSDPKENEITDKRIVDLNNKAKLSTNKLISINSENNINSSDWKEIVRKRIEAKTKIISKGSGKVKQKGKENKYSEVFGYFFFPLMKPYDQNRVYLKILDSDFMLLGKLIFTLSIILYSAVNTNIIENMVKTMLDFVWSLRNHKEPYIRKSILFAYNIIFLSAPTHLLLTELQYYVIEIKHWLDFIRTNDPDLECQRQAMECLELLSLVLKKEMMPDEA